MHEIDENEIAAHAVMQAMERDNNIVMSKTGAFYEIPVSVDVPDGWKILH